MPLTAALLLLVLTGCNTVEVRTFADPRFEIPQPAKYTWEIGGSRLQGVLPGNRAALQAGIQQAITRELYTHGWMLVDAASADVVVRYAVGAHNEQVVTQTVVGESSFGGTSSVATQQHRVRAGEMAIDFVHPEAGVVMWRGVAEGTLENVPDPAEAAKIADRVTTRILDEFSWPLLP